MNQLQTYPARVSFNDMTLRCSADLLVSQLSTHAFEHGDEATLLLIQRMISKVNFVDLRTERMVNNYRAILNTVDPKVISTLRINEDECLPSCVLSLLSEVIDAAIRDAATCWEERPNGTYFKIVWARIILLTYLNEIACSNDQEYFYYLRLFIFDLVGKIYSKLNEDKNEFCTEFLNAFFATPFWREYHEDCKYFYASLYDPKFNYQGAE